MAERTDSAVLLMKNAVNMSQQRTFPRDLSLHQRLGP